MIASNLLGSLGPVEWMQMLGLALLFDVPRYLLAAVVLAFLPPRPTGGSASATVSGLIACHNEAHSLHACVESMRANGVNEIVVVNDGSTDWTHAVALDLGVTLVDMPARVGKAQALNAGLALCTGELVLVADADVTFSPDSVLMGAQRFEPNVAGVGLDLTVRNENASLVTRFQAVEYAISITASKQISDALGILPNVSGAAGLFNRAALEQVGGWDVEVAEDAALAMKLRVAGFELGFAPLAHASTLVPETMVDLILQRLRWDACIITIWWRKFKPRKLEGRNLLASIDVLLFGAVLPLLLPPYLIWMWSKIDGHSILVLLGAVMLALALLELIILLLLEVPLRLLFYVPLFVVLQILIMRPVRVIALIGELAFNITRRDDYVPPGERWRLT